MASVRLVLLAWACALPQSAVPATGGAQAVAVFQQTGPSLLKIEAGGHAASGFIWGDSSHAVTSLHVVDGSGHITANYVGPDGRVVAVTPATVERVLEESDLVLLRLQSPQARPALTVNPNPPAVKQSLDALGFPLNIAGYSNTEVKVRFGGSQLQTILPPKVLNRIVDYPSKNIEILNLEGNLVPGLSGAPIIDADGRVVGVVDGGLEDGAVGICWGIPASQLQRLAQSTVTRMPGSPQVTELFAADLDSQVEPTQALGRARLTKLRSRTFGQLAASADDKLGLSQLVNFFRAFNPVQFRYDVYQDASSGAYVVVPEGARIEAQGEYLDVHAGGRRMSMKMRIEPVAGQDDAQGKSLQFEQEVAAMGPGVVVAPDPQWSYLQPMRRQDLLINRKAIERGAYVNGRLAPAGYLFETLATNGRSLLGVAALNNDTSMATFQLEAACSNGVRDPRCGAVYNDRRLWAQMVMGVQFSSFPQRQF